MTGNLQTFGQVGPVFSLRVGLIVCIYFQISARIPLPALRATLPRGEGMDFFDKLRSRPFWVGSGMDRIYLTARVLYFLVLFTNRTSMEAAKTMPTTTAMG